MTPRDDTGQRFDAAELIARGKPAGEIRGKSINGGVTKRLAAGDIVHIPAKMPHRLSVEAGKVCTYLVFKVRME